MTGVKRKFYVWKMMRAIDCARGVKSYYVNRCSKSAGLRMIRRFEAINSTEFNPWSSEHIALVRDKARFFEAFRAFDMFRCNMLGGMKG